jgi:hypothetical protein
MTYNDWIGTLGVGIILLAYFFNTTKMIPENGKLFFVLNTLGGALSCYAAVLIDFIPFVVLEAIWTVVSIYGLFSVGTLQRPDGSS